MCYSYLEMEPVVSIFNFSFLEHCLKMLKRFFELWEEQGSVVEVGDTRVLGVPAHIDDLAPCLKQCWRQH
jgi:hypothetical protein